jgi:hypothetical protein
MMNVRMKSDFIASCLCINLYLYLYIIIIIVYILCIIIVYNCILYIQRYDFFGLPKGRFFWPKWYDEFGPVWSLRPTYSGPK